MLLSEKVYASRETWQRATIQIYNTRVHARPAYLEIISTNIIISTIISLSVTQETTLRRSVII